MRRRRKRLVVVLALLAGGSMLLGSGVFGGGNPTDLPPYPDPPAELTNESATQAAAQYEATYVERHLATSGRVESYTVSSTVAVAEKTVVARNEAGVSVRVRHPYGYSTNSGEADGLTNATYLVNESAIVEVSRESGLSGV